METICFSKNNQLNLQNYTENIKFKWNKLIDTFKDFFLSLNCSNAIEQTINIDHNEMILNTNTNTSTDLNLTLNKCDTNEGAISFKAKNKKVKDKDKDKEQNQKIFLVF